MIEIRLNDSHQIEMGDVREVLKPTIQVLCDEIKRLIKENEELRIQIKTLQDWHDSHL